MPRINGINGHNVESLLLPLYQRRNFNALVRKVQELEENLDPQQKSKWYLAICQLGMEEKRYNEVAKYAIKILSLDFSDVFRKEALENLASLALFVNQRRIEKSVSEQIRGQLGNFALKFKDRNLSEKTSWLFILHTLFPQSFLGECLELAEEVFHNHPKEEVRADAATIFLTTARRLVRIKNGKVDASKIREKAEYCIDKFPNLIRQEWDNEAFHTFIVDLGFFRLFDLQEKALAVRQPPKDDLVWRYFALNKKYQEKGFSNELYQEVTSLRENFFGRIGGESVIFGELSILYIILQREYAEANKKEIDEIIETFEPRTWFEWLLFQPCENFPRVRGEMQKILKRIFQKLKPIVVNKYSLGGSSFSLLGKGLARAHIICSPVSAGLEIYIENQVGKFYKIKYPLIFDQKNEPITFSTIPIFEGLSGKAVPLLLEYLSFQAVTHSNFFKPDFQRELNELSNNLKELSYQFFLESNKASFEEVQGDFPKEELGRYLDQLENRRRVAEDILKFIDEIKEGEYCLGSTDFLASIISTVRIVKGEKLRDYFSQNDFPPASLEKLISQSSIAFVGKTIKGREFWGILDNFRALQVLGVKEVDSLLCQYLEELLLEAIVKISGKIEPKDQKEVQSGYFFIPPEGLDLNEVKRGLENLEAVYQAAFYEQLREKGLLFVPWYFYNPNSKLYYPLSQDPKEKEKYFKEKGPNGVFVQVQPSGLVVRLPVRLKRNKESGKLELMPWEGSSRAEEQQKLLGDNRQLPKFYGLYIITTFNDGSQHAHLYSLRKSQDEILADALLEEVEREVKEGKFRDPSLLFKHDKKKREEKSKLLAEGKIKIVEQSIEIYELQYTFRRPHMIPLSKLLNQGFKLK